MIKNSFLRNTLVFGAVWTIMFIGFRSAEHDGFTITILLTTLLEGMFIGFFWAFFMKLLPSDAFKSVRLDLAADEMMVMESGAYLMGVEKHGEGGKLGLTNRRLLFKGQRYDTRKFQLSFELEKMENLRIMKSWMRMKNELCFELPDGKEYSFAVDHPNKWLSALKEQMITAGSLHVENVHL